MQDSLAAAEKDSYQFQRARVERIAKELVPGKTVEFDEASTLIKFRIRDDTTGVSLTQPSGEWFPFELAEKADNWLREFIRSLGNGKF